MRTYVKSKPAAKRSSVGAIMIDSPGVICPSGYHPLSDTPEVAAAIWCISDLLASMTIHLMQNTSDGDIRIKDELAKKVDIAPWSMGTRQMLVGWIVTTMLLEGNAFVMPVTQNGYLEDLIPMPDAYPVRSPDGLTYTVSWRGVVFQPDEVLHFVLHPDLTAPWRGTGIRVQLQDVVESLVQATSTKTAYMSSEYKPPLIISVNTDSDLSDKEQRKKFIDANLSRSNKDEPWIFPAELMHVEQAKPLSLNDLAIRDGVELDKKSIASVIGVPGFLVGVGDFDRNEYNTFIRRKVLHIAQIVEQELTKKLLLSPERYFRLNSRSLYSYDLKELSSIGDEQYTRGLMTGNEVRDWIGLPPKKGLDKLVILENYLPIERIGDQKKLKEASGNGEE